MALIVPEAQTPFSPVEQPRLNPNAPTIGAGIAAVGDTLGEIRARKVQAENDRAVRGARLDALEAVDRLRHDYEQDTNLEGLTDRWEAASGRLAAEAAKGLPAHLRADFELGMREMIAPQTSAIRRRELSLWRDRETAALNADMRRWAAGAARAPDHASRDAQLAEAGAAVERARALGLITAVEADSMMADLPANAERIEAMGRVEEDPEGFLEDLAAGQYPSLPPDQAKGLELVARRNAARAEAERLKADELVAKATDRELGTRVDGAVKVIEAGLDHEALPELIEEARGTPHYDRLAAAVRADASSFAIGRLSPAAGAEAIARFEATATADPADADILARMRRSHAAVVKGVADDLLAHVRDRKLMPVEPVDITDPASVARRIAVAETARDAFDAAGTIRYFDQAEKARLSALLSSPDPDRALAVVTAIGDTFGDHAGPALAELGEKDPLAHVAGALVLDTGSADAGRAILAGRRLKAEGKGATIDAGLRRTILTEYAPLVEWQILPDGRLVKDPRRIEVLAEAAAAHYAATGLGIADPKGEDAARAFRASLEASLARNERSSGTRGGVQAVNGTRVVLPGDVSAAEVERALVYFPESLWKRASLSGGPPLWGTGARARPITEFTAAERSRLTLVSLGGGYYSISFRTHATGPGGVMHDPARPDGRFVFDLNTLLRGVPK